MMTKEQFGQIKESWAQGTAFFSPVIDSLLEVAEAYFATAGDFVVIAQSEYDWLVDRSHRLEGLEL